MSEKSTSIYTRSLAEVQEVVRNKASSVVPRPSVSTRLAGLSSSRIRDGDAETDQFDLQRCLSSAVVTDLGYSSDGVLATAIGVDTRGIEMVVVIYVSDDDSLPLLVEDFVVAWP